MHNLAPKRFTIVRVDVERLHLGDEAVRRACPFRVLGLKLAKVPVVLDELGDRMQVGRLWVDWRRRSEVN